MAEASGRVVAAFLLAAAETGVDIAGALHAAELDMPEPDDRVPCERVFALASTLAERFGDPLFAVRQARAFRPHHLGVPGHLLTTAPTLRAGLEAMATVQRLYGDGLTVSLRDADDVVEVSLTLHASLADRPPDDVVESFLARIAVAVAEAGGGVAPASVRFRHQPRAGAAAGDVGAVLGFPAWFGGADDALVYERASLGVALPGRDPGTFRVLREHAEARSQRLEGRSEFRDEVRAAVRHAFDGTPVTAARVASEVGTSVRTMQRLLAAEGTTFAAVKDRAVYEYALGRLDRGAGSFDEVSAAVGYRDGSGLRRAMRRAISEPPGVPALADRNRSVTSAETPARG